MKWKEHLDKANDAGKVEGVIISIMVGIGAFIVKKIWDSEHQTYEKADTRHIWGDEDK